MNANFEKLRSDFPILKTLIKGNPLVYFDNSATTQKPQIVIDALVNFYQQGNANVHRGTYELANIATTDYENARQSASQFISAQSPSECVFVKGTTEGINLVASAFIQQELKENDEILITEMEHHSNIVPWQIACKLTGAKLKIVKCFENGELDLEHFSQSLNSRTKIVAMTHVSNVLGTINPIKKCVQLAHEKNIPVLVDGAQAIGHLSVNVVDLDCDFYAFSGHKMYGPTGIGVLYAKSAWLEKLPPYQSGGEMIRSVSFNETEYNSIPYKFEAGTPPIGPAIGLNAAIAYFKKIPIDSIQQHESELKNQLNRLLNEIPSLTVIGESSLKTGIISFSVNNIHPHDLATYLDHHGIALRAGQLCAEPLLSRFGYQSLLRVSFGLYNTLDEVNYFIQHLRDGINYFKK